jgi:hypothetical protein
LWRGIWLNVAFWALGSDDVAACCGAATFEVGELVSLVVAPANDSAFGAAAVAAALVSGDGATWCISGIAEVVSSITAPVRGVAFGSAVAGDVLACGEVDSFGIDDVVSAVDSPTEGVPLGWGVALGLAAISLGYERAGTASPRLNANVEPAAKGLGLGISTANPACEED